MSEQAGDISEGKPLFCLRPAEPIEGVKSFCVLFDDAITVGRHPSNSVVIPVESVSRYHARIERSGDRLMVFDLDSSNGTFIEKQQIEAAPLAAGQTVTFGNVEFRCDLLKPNEVAAYAPTRVQFLAADQVHSDLILTQEAGKVADTAPLHQLAEASADHETLKKAYKRLVISYKLGDILRSTSQEEQLLEQFLSLIFEIVPADRGVVLMREGRDGDFQVRTAKSREGSIGAHPIPISRTIIDRCTEERLAILSQDATTDERFRESDSIFFHDIRSTMAVPLISENTILGILHLDTHKSVRVFTDDDLQFVTSACGDLALLIAHRRVLEENLHSQQMAAVGEVVTDLAHSIKNILVLSEGSIKLMDDLLEAGDLERIRENWTITQKGLARVSTMVKEMLEYSRALQVSKSFCDLNSIVRETCHGFEPELDENRITLKLNLDERIEHCWLDAKGLERALVNLLINACEAVDHDHGEIVIATQLTLGRDLILSVEDNGKGIPPNRLRRIFFPLFSTKGAEGTGLGLAMVKKWTAAVGGTIRAYSTEGKGSRFVLTFPRESTSAPAVVSSGDDQPGDDGTITAV